MWSVCTVLLAVALGRAFGSDPSRSTPHKHDNNLEICIHQDMLMCVLQCGSSLLFLYVLQYGSLWVCVCIHATQCVFLCVGAFLCVCVFVCVSYSVCKYVCTYPTVCLYVFSCVCVCVYVLQCVFFPQCVCLCVCYDVCFFPECVCPDKRLFETKRKEQLNALKNLVELSDVNQQYKIIDIMLKGLFKVCVCACIYV